MAKLYPHELIGEKVTIAESKNQSLQGLVGEIVDETKNTLVIKTTSKTVNVLKSAIIKITLQSGEMLTGEQLAKRPEERIKGK